MSFIMTLIPLFGSKSGRFRAGASRGVDRWPSNRLFRAETHSIANPLKTQGVFPAHYRPVYVPIFS